LKKKFGIALIIIALGLLGLHLYYPLDYVMRVLIKQESNTDDYKWQQVEEIKAPFVSKKINRELNEDWVRKVFERDPEISNDFDTFLEQTNTTSFIVIRDSSIIYEKYFYGHSVATPTPVFSISKSIMSLLLGQSIERGEIGGLDTPITDYIPELGELDPAFSNITFANLVDMQSGIAYDGDVSFPYINSDDALIYYSNDLQSILLNKLSLESSPGTFEYNDYNPNIIALALTRATGETITQLVQERIWKALGAEFDGSWVTDWKGFPRAESGLVMRPVDLAKIGLAMLHCQEGSSVISKEWYQRSMNRLNEHDFEEYNGKQWGYSSGWWIVSRPEKPHDVAAIGAHGQYLYISPKNNIIIVRTGRDGSGWGDGDFISLFYRTAALLNENLR